MRQTPLTRTNPRIPLRLALLCGLLLPAAALAGHGTAAPPPTPPTPPTEEEKALELREQKAAELTDKAYLLQRQKSFNDAIELYQQALKLDPLPKRYFNLGIPLAEAGRPAEALAAFRHFQRDAQGEQPEYRREVSARIAELLKQMGAVTVSFPADSEAQVTATVTATPPAIDSQGERPRCVPDDPDKDDKDANPATPAVAMAPGDRAVRYVCQPGMVQAELRIAGVLATSRAVRVTAGGEERLRFSPREPVTLSSNRARPALRLDRVPLVLPSPETLPSTVPILLGPHEIEARDGRDVVTRRFQVAEGQPMAVDLRFGPSRRWIPWVVGGVVVAVAAGVLIGVLASPAPPGGADVTLHTPAPY